MDTYRLNFVDSDQSYTITTADSAVKGYMVVRAPKGLAVPTYFPKGSANTIHSMIGLPTAEWQDIQDAIDFNNQHGLWISAPAGTSEEYPTLYGGSYLTSRGMFPFYQVADKEEPNFNTLIKMGDEKATFLHDDGDDAEIEPIVTVGAAAAITISEIHPAIKNAATDILFRFWGNPEYAQGPEAKEYKLRIAGTKLQAIDPITEAAVEVGLVDASSITITGTTGSASFMALDFDNLVDSAPYKTDGVFNDESINTTHNEATYKAKVAEELAGRLDWLVNVEDITHLTFVQKSPNEKATTVRLTGIGYDKYIYDQSLSVYRNEKVVEGRTGPYPTAIDCGNADGLYVVINDEEVNGKTGIYRSIGNDAPPLEVTNEFRTQYIHLNGAGKLKDLLGDYVDQSAEDAEVAEYKNTLMYVTPLSTLTPCNEETAVKPKLNGNFNTISFSVEESVYAGTKQSGGSFHGSLDENGRDSYGSLIYFPSILPDDAASFIEVTPGKLFEVDSNGFFEGYRIIDQFAGPVVAAFDMKGQRYISKVNRDLVAKGTAGGAAVLDYLPILTDGWTAAKGKAYDPVGLFMEPSGVEELKENIYALRQNSHRLATYLSAKKITDAEAMNPSSIVVTGRSTGTAQCVNEFRRKDGYTGKKYWSNLVGAYGTKLARIMQDKMGGAAPMFTDIGGIGGQLAVTVEKAKYEWDKEQQQILDTKGLNTIILDANYGVMVINQKTTQDPTNLTDWSYLGHSMAFDLFKREMRDNVMIPQIGKPNDPHFQNMRQEQADAILAKRLSGTKAIWTAGKIDIASVNTPEVKAQRKFVIKATVKVTVISEAVELVLVNVDQMTSV